LSNEKDNHSHHHHHHNDHNSGSKNGNNDPMYNKYVSKDIYLDIAKLETNFYRADIEIHNVDHSGPSYEGRLFLNNADATPLTELNIENGYVGSYHIFGHGGCFGSEGHCEIPTQRRRLHDYRPSHHLRPQYKRVIITESLRKLGRSTNKFNITIIAVSFGTGNNQQSEIQNLIKFDKFGIILYS